LYNREVDLKIVRGNHKIEGEILILWGNTVKTLTFEKRACPPRLYGGAALV